MRLTHYLQNIIFQSRLSLKVLARLLESRSGPGQQDRAKLLDREPPFGRGQTGARAEQLLDPNLPSCWVVAMI